MKSIVLTSFSLLISGCATMLPHFKIEDSAVYSYGARKAVAEKCVEKNYLQQSDVSKYHHFAGLYLNLAVINEKAFQKGYLVANQGFNNQSNAQIKDLCRKGKKFYPEVANMLEQKYYERKSNLAKLQKTEQSQINSSLNKSHNSYKLNPIAVAPLKGNKKITPTPMYNASQCTGSIIKGKCHGTVIPGGIIKRCYGKVILGKCHGSLL